MNLFATKRGWLALASGLIITALQLGGCSSPDDSFLVGKWQMQKPSPAVDVELNKDHSFHIVTPDGKDSKGRWEFSGKAVTMYQDVRDGGSQNFGDGGDGGITYQLQPDRNTLTNKTGQSTLTLKKLTN